jgi:hypothetical protein
MNVGESILMFDGQAQQSVNLMEKFIYIIHIDDDWIEEEKVVQSHFRFSRHKRCFSRHESFNWSNGNLFFLVLVLSIISLFSSCQLLYFHRH